MKAKLLVPTLVIVSFALLFVIGLLSVSQSVSSQINTNNKRDQVFLAEISGGIDLNKSIIIQPLAQTNGVNDVSNRDVYSFFVKNPPNEEIAFSNAGFDLKVYQYDQDREIWEAIELLTYPEN